MVKNKNIYFNILVFVLLGCLLGCNSKYNSSLKYAQEVMERDYLKKDLLSFFPDKINEKVVSIWIAPPACLPTYECRAQFGDVYLVCKSKRAQNLTVDNVLYETSYQCDSNFIINLNGLKKNIFSVEKCNKWHVKEYPIPYFDSYDFGLGDKDTIKNDIDGDVYITYTYNIPSDLQVYVIQAEAGDFWKVSCGESRPNKLKEWKHGYSKGIAVSKKDDLIVYWVMIW